MPPVELGDGHLTVTVRIAPSQTDLIADLEAGAGPDWEPELPVGWLLAGENTCSLSGGVDGAVWRGLARNPRIFPDLRKIQTDDAECGILSLRMAVAGMQLADAWKAWIASEGGKLLLYARSRTASKEDAEDLLQEALVRLWGYQEERQYRPPDLPLAYSVLRLCGLDYGRKQGRREKRIRKVIEFHDYDEHWLDRGTEEDEEAELLRLAVEDLSEKLREVVVMKVWGGLTFAQIAEVMKVSQNTAASRYRYALEQLEKKLSHLKEARNG